MAKGSRPAPVRRFLRTPLWWFLAFLVPVAVALYVVYTDERVPDDAVRVSGTVSQSYEDGHSVPVTYRHPVTRQQVDVELYVWQRPTGGFEPGDRIDLWADPDDPDAVHLVGDHYPAVREASFVVWPLALPLAVWAWRLASVRRAERLARTHESSFLMLAVCSPPRRWSSRCTVSVFALDAPVGAQPLCTVPVLSTAAVPFGAAFQVQVKGFPRPHGRVLAHAPSGTLWPAGRALGRLLGARPVALAKPHPVQRAEHRRPHGFIRHAATSNENLRYLAAAGAVVLMLVVITVTMSGRADAADREATEPRVLAEILDRRDWDLEVDVVYERDGQQVTAVASAYSPLDFPVGRLYPAIVEGPSRVWLLGEPYDPREPIMWTYVPLVIGLALVASPLSDVVEARRVARHGTGNRVRSSGKHTGSRLLYVTTPEIPSGRVPGELQLAKGEVDLLGDPSPGEVVIVSDPDGVSRFARVQPPKA